MARFKITEEEYKAVKELERRTKDKNISRRLRVLMMKYEGKKNREIAEELGLHLASVSAMCMRYRKEGLEEYARNKYTSHCRLLSEDEEAAVLERFQEAAEAGQQVTVREMKAAFDEACGRGTGKNYIYMVLRRHGWRKVKPRPKHPKAASEEACEASKKLNSACWKSEKSASLNFE